MVIRSRSASAVVESDAPSFLNQAGFLCIPDRRRQIFDIDHIVVAQGHRSRNAIFELADVSGPVVLQKDSSSPLA